MIDAAIAVLSFALFASAMAFAGDWVNHFRTTRAISRRLRILARSEL